MTNRQPSLAALFSRYQARTRHTLSEALDIKKSRCNPLGNMQLLDAMSYSLMHGGKQLRPTLLYASALAVNPQFDLSRLDYLAAAVEAMHCYSLVHDDLPAMDDDDLRRGQPTCHKAYDEATAILVGDALQAFGFELVADAPLDAEKKVAIFQVLTKALGDYGMVLGQSLDLAAENQQLTLEQLAFIHAKKTGALIRASVNVGAIAAGADRADQRALDAYAKHLGLAFQIQDDILDVESDTAVLGKKQGADADLNKSTYPSLIGLDKAKQKARLSVDVAIQSLELLKGSEALLALADYVVARNF